MKKTKKIIALLLSALLCLSVIPFAALADEAATATSPVTSFPDGKNHSLVYMMNNPEFVISNGHSADSNADGAKIQKKITASTALTSDFESNFKAAEGILFHFDTTNTTANGTTFLTFYFEISYTKDDTTKSAYIASDLFRAAALASPSLMNGVVDETSTWYMTTDNGATWNPVSYTLTADDKTTGFNSQKLADSGTFDAYIYIPTEAMYSSVDFDGNGKPDSYADFVEAVDDFSIIGMTAAANGQNTKDVNAIIDDLMFAMPYKPVSAINGQDYSYAYMMQNPMFTVSPAKGNDATGMKLDQKNTTIAADFMDNFMTADGIMFKIDTTAVPATSETYFTLIFYFESDAGNGAFCSDVYRAAARKNFEAENYVGMDSVWYLSTDNGATWTENSYPYTDTSTNLTAHKVADGLINAYVYIPFDQMLCDKDLNDDGKADTYADLTSYANFTVTQITAAANRDAMKNAAAYATDFMFVTLPEVEQTLSGSITLTDDIAYNVYTTLPAGATDDKVTFTMGDKTVEVAGVDANGQRKYSFTGILPQQIGETINFVWSATVDGEPVEIAKSGSVLDYVKAVLADEDLADWHDVAKTLVHYAAAAQAYTGVTEGLVNEGIAAVTPVDRDTLVIAYENSNLAVWTSAALRLDTAITLKIGVAAADGTDVTWAVGGKSGTAKVEDGYVYVSVNAYEITEAIELTCGDDTLTLSASWYLANKNTTDDTVLENLIQAIADYAVAAALKKGNQPVALLDSPTVAQIKLLNDGGMSYVVQMENGHYIVIDGGVQSATNTQYLMNYLIANKTGEKPMIDAWMFTHQHGDHLDNAFYILNNYAGQIEVKRFIYTWGIADSSRLESAQIDEINNYTTQFNNLRSKYPNTQLISMKQDDIYTIGTVKIHVLITAEQYAAEHSRDGKIQDLNYISAVWKMTFTQNTLSTDDDTTFMVLGDAQYRRLTYLVDRYGSALKSDVLQAAHHGLEGGEKTFYQAVDPEITLVPTYQARYEEWFTTNPSATYYRDYNAWLENNSDCYHSSNTYVVNMETLTVSQWAEN